MLLVIYYLLYNLIIFSGENLTVETVSKENYCNMKARNAAIMRVKSMNLPEFTHFFVFRAICSGEPESVNFCRILIKPTEANHPLFSEYGRMPKPEFFDEHRNRTNPKINEIKIDSYFCGRKRNFLVERMIDMHYRDSENVQFLKELEKEKVLKDCANAL